MADTKISNLTGYTPPLDADVLPIVDTANATTKKVTWANIKATLKTYFDTLYQAAGSYLTSGGALGTPSSGTLTNCSGLPLSGVVDSTTEALGVGSLEIGHASDTTLARVSAGVASIEGKNIALNGTGEALTTGTIELGHATDTTISRVSAGVAAIEGVNIVTAGSATTSGLTMNTAKLLGRNTASAGAIEEITLGTNLSFSGTTLNAAGGSSTDYSCRVYQTGATSVTSSWVALAFAAENFDTDTMHDNVTNNTRITFTHAGKYCVGGSWYGATNAVTGIRVKLNGTTVLATHIDGNAGASLEYNDITTFYNFAANDYVELEGYSGTTQDSSGDANSNFWAFLVA